MSTGSLLDRPFGRFELARGLLACKVFLRSAELRQLPTAQLLRKVLLRVYRLQLEAVATRLYGDRVHTSLLPTMLTEGANLAVCASSAINITLTVGSYDASSLVVNYHTGQEDFTNDLHVALHMLSTNTAKHGGWWDAVELPVLASAVARLVVAGLTDDDLRRLGLYEYGYSRWAVDFGNKEGHSNLPRWRDPLDEVWAFIQDRHPVEDAREHGNSLLGNAWRCRQLPPDSAA